MPKITPQGTQIGNPKQAKIIMAVVDEEVCEIITRIREQEEAYKKGQETARKQVRTTYNSANLNSCTPIRNTSATDARQHNTERTTQQEHNAPLLQHS